MKAPAVFRRTDLSPLLGSWLALVTLTGLSLLLANRFGTASWLQLPVAAIVWVKGWIVARYFIESHRAHSYIAWLLRTFILCVPFALVLTAVVTSRGH